MATWGRIDFCGDPIAALPTRKRGPRLPDARLPGAQASAPTREATLASALPERVVEALPPGLFERDGVGDADVVHLGLGPTSSAIASSLRRSLFERIAASASVELEVALWWAETDGEGALSAANVERWVDGRAATCDDLYDDAAAIRLPRRGEVDAETLAHNPRHLIEALAPAVTWIDSFELTSRLSARLQPLALSLALGGIASRIEVAGQEALRVVSADGSRAIAVLDAAEWLALEPWLSAG